MLYTTETYLKYDTRPLERLFGLGGKFINPYKIKST